MKLGGICGGDALKSLLMPLTFASSSKNGNFTAKTLKRAKTVPPATQATRLLVTSIMDKSPWDSTAICTFFRHFSVPS